MPESLVRLNTALADRYRIEAMKASIPQATLDDLVASGQTLSPAEVLGMVRE